MLSSEEVLLIVQTLSTENLLTASGVAVFTTLIVGFLKKKVLEAYKQSKWYSGIVIGCAVVVAVASAYIWGAIYGVQTEVDGIMVSDWLMPLKVGLLGAFGSVFGHESLSWVLKLFKKGDS
jgi:hypothetical protein